MKSPAKLKTEKCFGCSSKAFNELKSHFDKIRDFLQVIPEAIFTN